MQVGDLVRHIMMGPNCITPGLVVDIEKKHAMIPQRVMVLWAGEAAKTYVQKQNLEVVSASR